VKGESIKYLESGPMALSEKRMFTAINMREITETLEKHAAVLLNRSRSLLMGRIEDRESRKAAKCAGAMAVNLRYCPLETASFEQFLYLLE
jgi:hypothetical protein